MKNSSKLIKTTLLMVMLATGVGLLGGSFSEEVFASESKKIVIKNGIPGQDLIFKEVENRQDVKIVTEPPKKIDPLDGAGFSVAAGDSEKNYHLNVKYYVGETGSDEVIGFGFKGDVGDFSSGLNCFVDVPESITGSHDGCHTGTITYTFQAKQ